MTPRKKFPLTFHETAESLVAIWQGRPVRYATFLQHVHQVARALPERDFAVNLCEDRYLFLVSFVAVILRRQTNLLPASKLPAIVNETKSDYTNSYILSDDENIDAGFLVSSKNLINSDTASSFEEILVDADQVVAVVFTSGSTGKPMPNIKTWGALYHGARLAIQRFKFCKKNVQAIVATVPPQHMYGLETSIVIPLLSAVATICATTFYPADVEAAVKGIAGKCVLVTTPIHLKAFVEAKLDSQNIEYVISATAAMPLDLAEKTENRLKTKLYEIYGASEFGSIASRRTLNESVWTLYDEMQLISHENGDDVIGPQLKTEIALHDRVDVKDAQHFELIGRNTDLVKIAGKRISLGELNQKLAGIDGVLDGVFFLPQDQEGKHSQRLTAFVVAPGLEKQVIIDELKKRIDPVFLPRPLLLVDELPRNSIGKLPRIVLNDIYKVLNIN